MKALIQISQHLAYHGDTIALSYKEQDLSYLELDKRSTKIAQALQQLNFPNDGQLGIYTSSPIETVTCIVAALKANIPFVPLDISHPTKRIEYMIGAAKVAYVILCRDTTQYYNGGTPTLHLETLLKQDIKKQQNNPHASNKKLIYTLFTSGSTGKPKGAGLLHQGINNLLSWYINTFKINTTDRFLSCTSLGFDLTLKNVLSALAVGARVFFIQPQELNPLTAISIIKNQQISLINCTPSIFYSLLDNCRKINDLQSLRFILLGGERIKPTRLRVLQTLYPATTVVNTYGPTECSDITCSYRLTSQDLKSKLEPPIGKPIPNVKLLILDDNFNPVPQKSRGRLFISGISVGAGYFNDKELTKKKFTSDPFVTDGSLMYDTGDIVKQLDNGNIQFIDRADNQIKLRGLRIELGEIEKTLLTYPSVKDAVVIPYDFNDTTSLVAFIIPNPCDIDINHLRPKLVKHLSNFLPDYMLPQSYEIVSEFPKNQNAKIDRKKLSESLARPPKTITNSSAEVIKQIIELFRIALGDSALKIDPKDSFFELGGYSLKSFQLLSMLSELFHVELDISDLITYPSPALLSQYIQEKMTITSIPTIPQEKPLLSNAQKRIASLLFKTGENRFNLPMAYIVKGNLNIEIMKKAVLQILQRHTILRSQIKKIDEQVYFLPVSMNELKPPVDFFDISSLSQKDQQDYIDFHIAKAVSSNTLKLDDIYFHVVILKINKHKFFILFNFHHVIIDGSSWSLFKKELNDFYNFNDKPFRHILEHQYSDYVIYEASLEPTRTKKESFKQFLMTNGVYDQSQPYQRTPNLCYRQYVKLTSYDSAAIKSISKHLKVTVNSCLYSVFYLSLQKLIQNVPNIGFVYTNRLNTRFNNTIGVYIEFLPCKIRFHQNNNIHLTTEVDQYFKQLLTQYSNISTEQADPNYSASILFAFQNTDELQLNFNGLDMALYPIKSKISVFQLEFHVWPEADNFLLEIIYNPLIYQHEFIESLQLHFSETLKQLNSEINTVTL